VKVRLVSQDPVLQKLCRETVEEFGPSGWELVSDAANGFGECLTIWDYTPGLSLALDTGWNPARHLFLVSRPDIEAFRHTASCAEAPILLKPVSRKTLSAFLAHSLTADEGQNSSANLLRADRDEILQCLINANVKLQEYDQDRTNFLARGVHDFRAPLTAINGYCGLLLGEALGPISNEQREVIQRMEHSAKRLSRMASAMFQLSAGRQIKNRPDLRRGDIQECIEQALHETGPQAKGKQISIALELEQETRPLYFEQERIEELLINLLDNACRFTPRNGQIDICGYPYFWERRSPQSDGSAVSERRRESSMEANAYRLDISNSGTPIPQQHLKNIFEEYTSYAGGHDRSGGGLGLAICRMIAVQHCGHIWAENTAIGPRFSCVLPVSSEHSPLDQTDEK
jgi:signal transduction histidine kinase